MLVVFVSLGERALAAALHGDEYKQRSIPHINPRYIGPNEGGSKNRKRVRNIISSEQNLPYLAVLRVEVPK